MLSPLFFTSSSPDDVGPFLRLEQIELDEEATTAHLDLHRHTETGSTDIDVAPDHWLPTLVALIFECST